MYIDFIFFSKFYLILRKYSLPLSWHYANKGDESQQLITNGTRSVTTWIK